MSCLPILPDCAGNRLQELPRYFHFFEMGVKSSLLILRHLKMLATGFFLLLPFSEGFHMSANQQNVSGQKFCAFLTRAPFFFLPHLFFHFLILEV